MDGTVEWKQLASLLIMGGTVVGVWYRLQSQISANRAHHEKQLAAYQLHVAESYTTKADMSEQTAQIMKAIDNVGIKIDRTNERLDKAFQATNGRG